MEVGPVANDGFLEGPWVATVDLGYGRLDLAQSPIKKRHLDHVAREQTGLSLDADEREQLLRLAAYHNRIFRLPPPVLVTPGEVMGAYPALVALYDKLSA